MDSVLLVGRETAGESPAARFDLTEGMLVRWRALLSKCAITSHFVRGSAKTGFWMLNQPLGVPRSLIGRVHLETFTNPFWRQAIARHAHHFVEGHLLVRGHAVVVVGDRRIDLPTGALLWLPPRTEHLTLEASPGLRRWCLCLRVGAVRQVLSRGEAAPLLSRGKRTQLVQLPRVELLDLARIFEDVKEQTGRGASVANAGLAYALARAVQATRQATPSDDPAVLHPVVARALSLMQGEGLLLSRDDLAARCRVSPTHLSRLFVRELGQPLRDVRNRKRLARYQELLASGRCDSLTEAALEAGFGSYSQFHRVFTLLTGRSPRS
jgi:AraC-like DNA-binding protein